MRIRSVSERVEPECNRNSAHSLHVRGLQRQRSASRPGQRRTPRSVAADAGCPNPLLRRELHCLWRSTSLGHSTSALAGWNTSPWSSARSRSLSWSSLVLLVAHLDERTGLVLAVTTIFRGPPGCTRPGGGASSGYAGTCRTPPRTIQPCRRPRVSRSCRPASALFCSPSISKLYRPPASSSPGSVAGLRRRERVELDVHLHPLDRVEPGQPGERLLEQPQVGHALPDLRDGRPSPA